MRELLEGGKGRRDSIGFVSLKEDSGTVCEALLVPKRSEFSEEKGLSQPAFEMLPPYCQLVANSLAT